MATPKSVKGHKTRPGWGEDRGGHGLSEQVPLWVVAVGHEVLVDADQLVEQVTRVLSQVVS